MSIPKVKAAAYAIGQRIKGNHLLKNPKGTPATTVTTMMHTSGIDFITLDKSATYVVTTKDFSKKKPSVISKYLFVDNFSQYNKTTKNLDYSPKAVNYAKYKDKKLLFELSKGVPDYNKLDKRDLSHMEKTFRRKETYTDFTGAFIGHIATKSVMVKKTFRELALDKYFAQRKKDEIKSVPFKRNFFKTLWQNLTQK